MRTQLLCGNAQRVVEWAEWIYQAPLLEINSSATTLLVLEIIILFANNNPQ